MAIVNRKDRDPARDFAPYMKGENAVAFLRNATEQGGYSRLTDYHLEIINILSQNGKEIFERIPSEALGGLAQGGRSHVQASFIARAEESAVRPEPGAGGGQERDDSVDPVFSRWDRQEAALEAWARHEGIWKDNIGEYAKKQFGDELDHGNEARVFNYDDNNIVKVLTCPFDVQETLDRISLTNFLFTNTGLELLGLGRDEIGQFCFLVKQQFIQGKHPDVGENVDLTGLEEFEPVTKLLVDPIYATKKYLLGDLHMRNIIVDKDGNAHVIDCNLFLNTPDQRKGGEWIIPEVQSDPKVQQSIQKLLDDIMPKQFPKALFGKNVRDQVNSKGYFEGTAIMSFDAQSEQILVQQDPDNPDCVLVNSVSNVLRLAKYDERFKDNELGAMARGCTLHQGDTKYRFDLNKGRIIAMNDRKLSLRMNEREFKALRNSMKP